MSGKSTLYCVLCQPPHHIVLVMFKKESLEKLKERIDLVEIVSGYIDLKRSGSSYKALCPFHHEKSPSFTIQRGDTHYHCFGCAAHGDAIQFVMNYLNLSFVEAVETLAEKFQITLEQQQQKELGPDKNALKEALTFSSQFFHIYLLYAEQARPALCYLFRRGITIDFIKRFEIGLAPSDNKLFWKLADKKKEWAFKEAGILGEGGGLFFRDRITFPIRNSLGNIIGFSARKFREQTFGGKYINTAETPLFKKSQILFGLNYCRRRIAKERHALLVEGQIDCLKMIEAGLNMTVAVLGTAFGESHVEELKKLGLRTAYLLFDGDEAGKKAASKVGDLLQSRGIEVFVVILPDSSDPDAFLMNHGMHSLLEAISAAESYLVFQISYLGRELDFNSPAAKAELASQLKKQVAKWQEPVMVHESLRKIASLIKIPEEMMQLKTAMTQTVASKEKFTLFSIDSHRVLEIDLLRWLIFLSDLFLPTVQTYLSAKHFSCPACQKLFLHVLELSAMANKIKVINLLDLASYIDDQALIDQILKKRINRERAEPQFLETVQKLLDREWMQRRELIKMEIHSGRHNEEKILEFAKEFDRLKSQRPQVHLIATGFSGPLKGIS